MDVPYEPIHKPRTNFLDKLIGVVFGKPYVYFFLLLSLTVFIVLFCPHTIIFKDDNLDVPDDFELSQVKSGWHANKHLTRQKYSNLPASHLDTIHTQGNTPQNWKEINVHTSTVNKINGHSKLQASISKPEPSKCKAFQDNQRFDCFPRGDVTEDACKNKGCCWAPVNSTKGQLGVPFCYYPSGFQTYSYSNISTTDFGVTALLENKLNSSYPDNIQLLRVDVNFLTESTLQIKIYDANKPRFESPFPNITLDDKRVSRNSTLYTVQIDKDKLGFNVLRKSNNQSIFNSQDVGGFIFANQLLQISAKLPSRTLYGLGQQRNDFQLDMDWRRVTLFNHDREPADKTNLYGSHPFYLAMEDDGLSHGVFLHNTNAMDIILQPLPAITYRTIGGVLDFYFMLGPTPADVIRQYTELIGRPTLPPYWSLGFHLCRYGYESLEKTKEVWKNTKAAGIPYDTQWNDIDYMDKFNDFTYDKTSFKGLPEFVDQLHKEGMHYVIITDPGVSAGERAGTYPPYDEGIKAGIFVKDPVEDKPFLTKVWNTKNTVFPDFFHPKTQSYWTRQISRFHDTFPFDGLWIDMNDPSTEWSGGAQGCAVSPLDNPPYLPAVEGGKLCYRTVCMTARHYNNSHYDVHNIFASQETLLTYQALAEVKKRRPFIISRSSYPGQGHYSGVWTGDISSSWDDMAHSITDILAFSLFGIPLSGADICGFNGNTTVPLCRRWSQLGAFYPFSRNHNSIENFDQDPVSLGEVVVEAARKALLTRYSLLPYLYTLFWKAHTLGDTVARPMFVQFPKDDKTYSLNGQFLWGAGLLIAPLLSEEKTYPTAYLPKGRWYDFYSCRPIDSNGSTYLLPSSADSTPLLLKGGEIIPTQLPNTTTTASRKNPFGLLVPLCEHGCACGDLYWDDGDSLDFEDGIFNHLKFKATSENVTSIVVHWTYKTDMLMSHIKVLGVKKVVTKVMMNGNPAKFDYKPDMKFLHVTDLAVDLGKEFVLSWS